MLSEVKTTRTAKVLKDSLELGKFTVHAQSLGGRTPQEAIALWRNIAAHLEFANLTWDFWDNVFYMKVEMSVKDT